MIINMCGSSGSGKSTVVKQLMSMYPKRIPLQPDNRKRPVAYTCKRKEGRDLFVLGHYETPCGGCDTLASYFPEKMLSQIYNWIRSVPKTTDVLYEGLLIESDVRRAIELHKDGWDFMAVFLNTPEDVCLDSVKMRREARGNFKPLNPKNTTDRIRQCLRRRERLTNEGGVRCEYLTRDDALTFVQTTLGLPVVKIHVPKPEPAPRPVEEKPAKIGSGQLDLLAYLKG